MLGKHLERKKGQERKAKEKGGERGRKKKKKKERGERERKVKAASRTICPGWPQRDFFFGGAMRA